MNPRKNWLNLVIALLLAAFLPQELAKGDLFWAAVNIVLIVFNLMAWGR